MLRLKALHTKGRLWASYQFVGVESPASRRLEVAIVQPRRRQTLTDNYDALRAKVETASSRLRHAKEPFPVLDLSTAASNPRRLT